MKKNHTHNYTARRPGGVETCSCGRFRFTEQYKATHPVIVETKPVAIVRAIAEGWEAVQEDGTFIRSEQLTNATHNDMERMKANMVDLLHSHGYRIAG